jgi:hypothetical protein
MQALPITQASTPPPRALPAQGATLPFLPRGVASAVPDDGLRARAVPMVSHATEMRGHAPALAQSRILHPSLAPSAVASENALVARSLMIPLHVHDSAASRIARLSNPMRDAPRFGPSVDLLA